MLAECLARKRPHPGAPLNDASLLPTGLHEGHHVRAERRATCAGAFEPQGTGLVLAQNHPPEFEDEEDRRHGRHAGVERGPPGRKGHHGNEEDDGARGGEAGYGSRGRIGIHGRVDPAGALRLSRSDAKDNRPLSKAPRAPRYGKCPITSEIVLTSFVASGRSLTEENRRRKTLRRSDAVSYPQVCDANVPDDDDDVDGRSLDESTNKESFQRFRKTKEADLTEYRADGIKIGQKIHHQAETSEGERYGEPIDLNQMENLSTRLRRMRLRSQNHKLALEGASSERKDVLTKKPLSFDQEEETRKVETSKWLEHHFGSESTKSSKGSQDDLADMPSNHNSFINVTMTSRPIRGRSPKTISFSDEEAPPPKTYYGKTESREIFISSPEYDSPPEGGYFRGIGHWDSRKSQETKTARAETRKTIPDGHRAPPESPPPVITSHRINPVPLRTNFGGSAARKESESSPVHETRTVQTFQTNGTRLPRNSTPVKHDVSFREPSPSPIQRNLMSSPEEDVPSPPARRKQNRINYEIQSWDKRQKTDEKPNYSTRTPSPIEDEIIVREEVRTVDLPSNKKLYQRTRFAADIPPPQQGRAPPPSHQQAKHKSKIGESFRKFVGRLRSTSSERKLKKRNGKNGSRSPSPKNTYQNYSVVDNNIPSAANRVGREHMGEPVAPPRGRPGKSENGSLVDSGTQTKVPGGMERKLTQRYYLGEDPFSGSIYGREREYQGVVPMKARGRSREQQQHRPGSRGEREDEIQHR